MITGLSVIEPRFRISEVAGTPRSTAKIVHRCLEASRSVGDSEARTRMQCRCRKLKPRLRFFFSRQHRLKLILPLISPSGAAWGLGSVPFSIYGLFRNRAERSRAIFPLTASTVVERWPREKGALLPCRAVRPERGLPSAGLRGNQAWRWPRVAAADTET
jgi:hypothetical protein